MYAIVRIGGRQYQAEVGKTIVTEKLPYEVGDTITLDEVMLIADGDNTAIGAPLVEGASITAEVVDQFKGDKIRIFKYKPKKRYRKRMGHRQRYTRIRVDDIAVG